MAVSISSPASRHSRAALSQRAFSHLVSVVWIFTLIALTGLVTGLIVTVVFVGVLSQLATTGH